jgi:flagellar basal-body rod protein FlgF
MDRLIYTALTAMRGAMARQTSVANNLANAQTPGFRADMAEAQALWIRGTGMESRAPTSEEVVNADMTSGTVVQTGRDLDVAVSGQGMIAVQAPNGEEAYTRRGDLQVSESGLLTTGDGHPVLGAQGPINVPTADNVTIDSAGRILVVPAGAEASEAIETGRLRLVNPSGLGIAKGLDGLFRARAGGTLPDDPDIQVQARALEGSNVSSATALVEMIEASRAWDAQLKMMASAQEMDASGADLMQLQG